MFNTSGLTNVAIVPTGVEVGVSAAARDPSSDIFSPATSARSRSTSSESVEPPHHAGSVPMTSGLRRSELGDQRTPTSEEEPALRRQRDVTFATAADADSKLPNPSIGW